MEGRARPAFGESSMNNCPSKATAKLVRAVLDVCGEASELVGAHEREWASATFCGARHCLDLLIPAASDDTALS